ENHQQHLIDMASQFDAAIETTMPVDTLRSLHQIFERITAVAIVGSELLPVLNEIVKSALEILNIDVITIYQYDQARGKFIVPPLMKGLSEAQSMQTDVLKGEAPWVLV